jgi:hypothetical protein
LTHSIRIGEKKLYITKNLHDFLLRERKLPGRFPLWIDAICIDQKNHPERQLQVAMMADVYSRASKMIIWLGEAEHESDSAFTLIRMLHEIFYDEKFNRNINNREPRMNSAMLGAMREHPVTTPHSSAWMALGKLMERPWFRRTWVIQEVVLSARCEVICGGRNISWDELVHAVSQIMLYEIRHFTAPTGDIGYFRAGDSGWLTVGVLKDITDRLPSLNLSWTLRSLPLFYATDPRDKIFGVLGIIKDAKELQVRVDYNVSISKLYLGVTRSIIEKERSLSLLAMAGVGWPTRTPRIFPSWVPDYANSGSNIWDTGAINPKPQDSASYFVFDAEGNELHLKGYLVDTLTRLGPPKEINSEHDDLPTWLRETQDMFGVPGANDEAFRQLLTARRSPDAAYIESAELDTHLQAYQLISGGSVGNMSFTETQRYHAQRFKSLIKLTINGRRLCETGCCRLALVPGGSEVGDLVCVVLDAPYCTFIVRPFPVARGSLTTYQLVGLCQVYGLMVDGEMEMEMELLAQKLAQEIVII